MAPENDDMELDSDLENNKSPQEVPESSQPIQPDHSNLSQPSPSNVDQGSNPPAPQPSEPQIVDRSKVGGSQPPTTPDNQRSASTMSVHQDSIGPATVKMHRISVATAWLSFG